MDCLQVRADLDALCASFKTAVPEDIDDRAETLELFLAQQNLRAMTVYDEAPTKNMFKMGMKVMHKDLKELVSTAYAIDVLPIDALAAHKTAAQLSRCFETMIIILLHVVPIGPQPRK